MTLQRDKNKQYAECDECGEELLDSNGNTFKFGRDEFDVFLERMKIEGWESQKEGDQWKHICPDCQDD